MVTTRRLVTLDALRGLAALAVVLSHVAEPGGTAVVGSALANRVAEVLVRGRVGVVLFFVISGFCIHLRWAKGLAAGRATPIDFASFWKQRFIRLYPPYLVALGLYLVVQTRTGAIAWTGFDIYDLVLHLTMLHNLDARTIFNIDGVFWTLAIEEQLYLAYFLLLPLRNRLGWAKTLAVCAGARVGWFALAFAVGQWGGGDFRLVHDGGSLAHWWSWALGAVCVEAALGLVTLPRWLTDLRWAACFGAAGCLCDHATGHHLGGGIGWRLTWLIGSPLWGLGCFILVNRLVQVEAAWREAGAIPRSVTLCAGLGLISYSLYLTHNLILKHAGPPLLGWLGLNNDLAGRCVLVAPALGLAWVFFKVCEQPFLRRASRARGLVPPAAVAQKPPESTKRSWRSFQLN